MPRRSLEGPKKAPDLVPRNSRGGVLVTDDELKSAFDFFDVEGSGKITQAQLKKRLGVFYKDMPNKEYKFLMNDQSELTLDDLRELLLENEVKNFDPVAEAFKVYDPEGTGFIDTSVLKAIFENLGFGEISEDDLAVLTRDLRLSVGVFFAGGDAARAGGRGGAREGGGTPPHGARGKSPSYPPLPFLLILP